MCGRASFHFNTMIYEFAAQRQFIFSVQVDGRTHLVQFGEQNQFGSSIFQTQASKIADMIRNTPLFKNGAINETTIVKEPEKPAIPVKNKSVETKATTPITATGNDEKGERKQTFSNFSQAREWFCKTFNIPKRNLRTPTALQKLAIEKCITVIYKQE